MLALDLKSQYKKYKKEIDREIKQVIASANFIQGKAVKEFENQLANYLQVGEAIGCSNGTDALFLALAGLGLKKGDEVITTPFTFVATVEAIIYLGAKPVFVDSDMTTFNIIPEQIEKKITKRTKVILPVSLFGLLPDMDAINHIAKRHKITVVEDAAQSMGAKYGTKKSGSLSPLATTSFFPSKPLGGYGDGGAVLVKDNPPVAKKIRFLLNHGQTKQYHHSFIGINGRLDTLQAGILKVKLAHLEKEIQRRNQIAQFYLDKINTKNFSFQKIPQGFCSAYAQFSLLSKVPRKKILAQLSSKQIPYAIYYPIPIHMQKAFHFLGYHKGDFPHSEKLAKTIFSIPIHPFLKKEELKQVVQVLNKL